MKHRRVLSRTIAGVFLTAQVMASSAAPPAPQGGDSTPNRTAPSVDPPSLTVDFDETPSLADITRARVLPEPLRPAGREPSAAETQAVARMLEAFAATSGPAAVQTLAAFTASQPESPWRPTVLVNLGLLQWRQGFFSRAAASWDLAWSLTKDGTDRGSRTVADVALGEWVTQAMNFGQVRALQTRLDEVAGRPMGGAAGNKVSAAREGLWLLTNRHEMAVFSGPEALKAMADVLSAASPAAHAGIAAYHPPHEGTSLTALRDLSRTAGVPLEMRFLADLDALPVPAIVHLKSEHFSAVVDRNAYGYVLRDPALGGELVMSPAALRDEATGYVLVPTAQPDVVGRVVPDAEGNTLVGHCAPGLPFDDEDCGCEDPPPGMPAYTLHPLTAAVLVTDTPVSYAPPGGPGMAFTLRYNQRTTRLGQTPGFGHVGPRWSFDWVSFVRDNNTLIMAPYSRTAVIPRGQGYESYNAYSGFTHWKSRVTLVKVSHDPARYERHLPDGSVEVYEFPDRAANLPDRKIFLTQLIDP